MGIVCNGVRRSGTHALVKCVRLLGIRQCLGSWKSLVPGGKLYHTLHGYDAYKGEELPENFRPVKVGIAKKNLGNFCIHAHVPYGIDLSPHKVIFVSRNPRDILYSTVRWYYKRDDREERVGNDFNLGTLEGQMCQFIHWYDGGNFLDRILPYLGWLQEPRVLKVKFEDLVFDGGQTIRRISNFVGADNIRKAKKGLTTTVAGKDKIDSIINNNWQDVWTEQIDRVWEDTGCRELDKVMGYGDNGSS